MTRCWNCYTIIMIIALVECRKRAIVRCTRVNQTSSFQCRFRRCQVSLFQFLRCWIANNFYGLWWCLHNADCSKSARNPHNLRNRFYAFLCLSEVLIWVMLLRHFWRVFSKLFELSVFLFERQVVFPKLLPQSTSSYPHYMTSLTRAVIFDTVAFRFSTKFQIGNIFDNCQAFINQFSSFPCSVYDHFNLKLSFHFQDQS